MTPTLGSESTSLPTDLPVVRRASELTADWLAAALGVDVAGVELQPIGTGQVGATYRATLTAPRASDLPGTLVVKIAAGSDDARALVQDTHRKEIGFYSRLASTVAARVPHCWYAAISEDSANFTLILDDLAPAVPGIQTAGCTAAQAHAAINNLGRLHGSRWNDTGLLAVEWMPRCGAEIGQMFAAGMRPAISMFNERYGSHLDEGHVELLDKVADALPAWIISRGERWALVHGDYRLDNLLFGPADTDVWAVDWQATTVAQPGRDVAYFLSTALPIVRRRAQQGALLEMYRDTLRDMGVGDISADTVWDDYRLGSIQGPLITVLGAVYATAEVTAAADSMFGSMIRRSLAAVSDLNPFELL